MITNERKGFTLIEILIVVAIIAILASIVLVGLGPTQQSGRDARRLSDLHSVQNVLELYYNKCGNYPGGTTCGAAMGGTAVYPAGSTAPASNYGGMAGVVTTASLGLGVTILPQDPSSGRTYYYGASANLTTPASYVLGAKLENPGGSSVFNNYTAPAAPAAGDIAQLTAANCTQAGGYYCVTL